VARTLHTRWLGTVPYAEALDLQRGLFDHGRDDWLLLLEHPHVYTLGARADGSNVLVDPASVGAELVRADRGGDVTYHGPGQLVGYPILTVNGGRAGGMARTAEYVHRVEQLVIDVLADVGLSGAGRLPRCPGVWVDLESDRPRKVAAIGVRISRGRSMHGFALNVAPDMTMFDHIVPCGIIGKGVTSLAAEGVDVPMRDAVDAVARRAASLFDPADAGAPTTAERADIVWRQAVEDLSPFSRGAGPGDLVVAPDRHSDDPAGADVEAVPVTLQARGEATTPRRAVRLAEAGVSGGVAMAERKPDWMRATVRIGDDYLRMKRLVADLGLVTVCEEAGCPNVFECWADGTATFMINGERCTRACGFCLVDTRHPEPLDATEPTRVAEAVERLGLSFAVITAVARDDLADGGAAAFAATIEAVRSRNPGVQVEVLIPDCRGDAASLQQIFDARPDVLNHNVETVARLQRAARPSAGYARSLAVLARAKADGLRTKSGMVLGMGETDDEVLGALADLAGVGVDIVTLGQYLRPTSNHLPVDRWVPPEQFAAYKVAGERLGIGHVESSPLTRSSYHARQAAGPIG